MSEIAGVVLGTIRKHDLCATGAHLLVALSGGADSTSLCRVLAELTPVLDLQLSACYVNHGLRSEENPDEIAFCRNLCEGHGITFFVEEAPAREKGETDDANLQGRAREKRYAALERRRGEIAADRIAVAHTADDQAETVVMRFIRGAGTRGLAGIPPRRGRIVRPLIDIRRTRVEAYLKTLGQSWCEDSSNRSPGYQRNRVRNEITPLLEKENPAVVESLSRTASVMAEEDAYLVGEARRFLDDVLLSGSGNEIELDATAFDAVPLVLRRRLVRLIVEDLGGGYGAGVVHTSQAMGTLASGGRVVFPNGVRGERSGRGIRFVNPEYAEVENDGFELSLDVPGSVMLPDGTVISAAIEPFVGDLGNGQTKAVFDPTKVSFPLTVRTRRPGDRMRPLGLQGWKKVQDILVDEKVPRYRRDGILVVTTRQGEILWLVGVRVDGQFCLHTATGETIVIRTTQETV